MSSSMGDQCGNQAFKMGQGTRGPRGAAFAVIWCYCKCVDLLNLWLFKSLLLIDSISIALWFSCFICFREMPSVLYAGMTSEVTCADVKMAGVEATTFTSWHWLDLNLKILWWTQTVENITIELQMFCWTGFYVVCILVGRTVLEMNIFSLFLVPEQF